MATPTDRFEGTPVSEVIALAGAVAFGLLSMLVVVEGDIPMRSRAIIGLPIFASILAVVTKKREITWLALGLCLGIAAVAFPGSGFFPFWTGMCVFLWWALSSRRAGRLVIVGSDLVWEVAGFAAMMIAIGLLLS